MVNPCLVSPIKDAKTHTIIIKNFSENSVFHKHSFHNFGGCKWSIVLFDMDEVEGSSLGFLMFCRKASHSDTIDLEFRVVVLNHETPEQSHGISRRSRLANPEGRLLTEEVCNYQFATSQREKYLKDGHLTVQIQYRVHMFIDYLDFRRFNFFDPIDDCFTFNFNGKRRSKRKLYVKKQLLYFHSPVFADMLNFGVSKINVVGKIQRRSLESVLQIVHGCQPRLCKIGITEQLSIAKRYKLSVATRKLEISLFAVDCPIEISDRRKLATLFNLHNLFKYCLKNVKSVEELKEVVKEISVEQLSVEMKKILAAKFFSFAKPFNIY